MPLWALSFIASGCFFDSNLQNFSTSIHLQLTLKCDALYIPVWFVLCYINMLYTYHRTHGLQVQSHKFCWWSGHACLKHAKVVRKVAWACGLYVKSSLLHKWVLVPVNNPFWYQSVLPTKKIDMPSQVTSHANSVLRTKKRHVVASHMNFTPSRSMGFKPITSSLMWTFLTISPAHVTEIDILSFWSSPSSSI